MALLMPDNHQLNTVGEEPSGPCEIYYDQPDGDRLLVGLRGNWILGAAIPSADEVQKHIRSLPSVRRIAFDTRQLDGWDSGLLNFLLKVISQIQKNSVEIDDGGLPEGVKKLLHLATAVPERKGARKETVDEPLLQRIGECAVDTGRSTVEFIDFIGAAFLALLKFLVGKARFQRSDLILFIEQSGAQALPIVTLISVLVGLIFAFIGAVQLMLFGAQIYVADLVGIAMVRVMGAVMTGVIMAGRTGAAFAAQIGTMQVNEEVDALLTLGISPMEFLVLPRMLALILMMPLLCIYSDLMGIIGGMIVGVGMLDIEFELYINQTLNALNLTHFWIGIVHSIVFGVLIALAGCLRGIQCGRSASAVGDATTSAVVTSIVAIVVATAIITVVCNVMGI
jgi:phospholipid/cholesterol/gamma-HCH transport system permease protein